MGSLEKNTHVIQMPGLHLCLKPKIFPCLFFIPYLLVPNHFEDEEKRKWKYDLKEGIGETFYNGSTQNIMTKDIYICHRHGKGIGKGTKRFGALVVFGVLPWMPVNTQMNHGSSNAHAKSQAWKQVQKRDDEIPNFQFKQLFGMDADRCADEPWQFVHACAVVFLPKWWSRWLWHHKMTSQGSLVC